MKFRNSFLNFSAMLVLVLLHRTSDAKEEPTPGPKGDKAERSSTGVLLVKHSQSTIVPQCSPGHVKLWEGYSLFSKDMGSTGSCVRKFSAIPFQPFHSNSAFDMDFRRNLNSFWLTTDLPNRASLIEGEAMMEYISRCAVCEVPTNVIVLHSQSEEVPSCPSGWDELWEGYSFVAYTPGNGDISPGNSPAGPGSCLFDFRTTPVIECWGEPGRCEHPAGKLSYWLAVIGVDSRKKDSRSTVSRCSVCSKKYRKVYVDVDECSEGPGFLCEQRCNNVLGDYKCSCHRGYRLNKDNRTCSDVDECTEHKSKILCIGRCVNEPGSYRCTCPPGYRLSEDKRSCVDIDECETGEAPCAGSAGEYGGVSDICLNTRGGYKCERISCPHGYKLESIARKHRCTKIDKVCSPTDWECKHQPIIYSFNFINLVSQFYIPDKKVDLFTMRGPAWGNARANFELRLKDVNAPPTVKDKADINAFLLTRTGHEATVSLVRSLQGPQRIELEISLKLNNGDVFGGLAVAKLFIFVSEYEF